MLINIVALLAYISIHTFYCPRMGRTLIKKWHLFMRITMPVIYERRERSNDEEIHDLINLIKNIYNGNPPKYMIREGKSETDVKLVM